MLARLIRQDEGQDLIEYLVLGSFIALVALAGATVLGRNINTWFHNVADWVGDRSSVSAGS